MLGQHPQVRAVFAGHMHMHYVETVNGIVHAVTGSLPEYPVEFRDVQVFDDRLEVRTLGVGGGVFAKRSLIPGKEWTAGEDRDRTFTVPLV